MPMGKLCTTSLITPAKKGLTLIWPTDFTHTHRGMPSFKTEKEIVTGWYSFCGSGNILQWT